MSRTIRTACLAAFSMVLALPSPAAAQGFLKHIKDKAKQAATQKAVEKLAGSGGAAAAGLGALGQVASPDQGSMELTSARIDQLIKGLSAERAIYDRAGARAAAGGRPRMPSEAEIQQAQECGKADMERLQRRHDSLAADPSSGYDPKMTAAMERKAREQAAKQPSYHAAAMKYVGDPAGFQRYNDSVTKSYRDASIRAARMVNSQCNAGPAGLTPDLIAQADSAGAAASGLPTPQYTMLRGRVAAYMAYARAGNARLPYSRAEQDVLKKRGRDLAPFESLLIPAQ